MHSIGMDIGYSAIKIVLVNDHAEILHSEFRSHNGDIIGTLDAALRRVVDMFGNEGMSWGAVTGSQATLIRRQAVSSVNEIESLIEGGTKTNDRVRSIIEIGGQTARYATGFHKDTDATIQFAMNPNCAAGTGSFLEDQVSRLGIDIESYAVLSKKGTSIPRIAGRCSVFAKTDITHHQQEGTPVEDILKGVAYALVKNYRGAVMRRLPRETPFLFVGGVARNQAIVDAMIDVLGIDDDQLVVPTHCESISAFGAALIACRDKLQFDVRSVLAEMEQCKREKDIVSEKIDMPSLSKFGNNDSSGKHACNPPESADEHICYLGVDVGSTSTNLVLMDTNNNIVAHRYLKTQGNPAYAVKRGLRILEYEWGERVKVRAAGVTGSGRYMVSDLIGGDKVIDEITAQATAATLLIPEADTVFEIGGQDSKFISLQNGAVVDFQMNKVCAAGTGSFLEEQAIKFNIPVEAFGHLALDGTNPPHLGERCTVFMETSITTHLAKGAAVKDIAAGLCYSVARNYLNRVVGKKKIGDHISVQGGVAYNQGVVNAFRALTGRKVSVPPFFSVSGAFGAAISAKSVIGGEETRFKGFDLNANGTLAVASSERGARIQSNEFNKKYDRLVFEGYTESIDPAKKTVGIPRALFTFGMYSMFSTVFTELGFNVLLSNPTNEETIRLGQQYSLDETCYPVKLINGHVAELIDKKVDYIFFPDLYTVDHPGSHTRRNFGCAYMQVAFKLVKKAMDLDEKGIGLLAPTIAFSMGKGFMVESFSAMGRQLNRDQSSTMQAFQKGMQAFHEFEERLGINSDKILSSIGPDDLCFVIISKIYGVIDPVLNMGIPDKLIAMGYKAIPFFELPETDISREHPNMFWPFGLHILEPAKLIRQHPNLFAILLTHHGCGPDSVFTHYFQEMMDGKPFLNIEVDEHSSDVGVITRLEAFINSLDACKNKAEQTITSPHSDQRDRGTIIYANMTDARRANGETTLLLPYLYPYSTIYAALLAKNGIRAEALPMTDETSVAIGREHTATNEYFAMISLIGDVLKAADDECRATEELLFFIPQTEGAEVDGQYARMIRAKLDETGHEKIGIVAPFVEDLPGANEKDIVLLILSLLTGDVLLSAPRSKRSDYLDDILREIASGSMDIDWLFALASEISGANGAEADERAVLAVGDPLLLFNEFANNFVFQKIENSNQRVIFSPLSECLYLTWRDALRQHADEPESTVLNAMERIERDITVIAAAYLDNGPFAKGMAHLERTADETLGYYAGAFGRYRAAKMTLKLNGIRGVLAISSVYENTGVAINVLNGESSANGPILNLTFDGNQNREDEEKIESFLRYL